MTDALATPLLFFWLQFLFKPSKPSLTEAQQAMISMLHAFSDNQENGVVQYHGRRWQHFDLIEIAMEIPPGGFFLIEGDYSFTRRYFLEHGWQEMSFMFGNHHIYRKPGIARRNA